MTQFYEDDIYIKDCGKYFTIINRNGIYENHAHVDSYKKAKNLKKDIERKLVPRGKYLRKCALRITLDTKYIEKINLKILKDSEKQQYRNMNKRCDK